MTGRELLKRLRQRRWRMTAQRRVIAEVLAGEHVHVTADEVHARARARLPEISRATVYNTLNELVALGEVLELSPDGGAKRYDPNAADPHHHLVCQGCGATRDVHPKGQARLVLPSEERHGFVLSGVEIMFRGLCPSCAGRRATKLRSRRQPRPPRPRAR